MLIPSVRVEMSACHPSLSRRVNANSQLAGGTAFVGLKLIKKGEC